jgi:sec-independent protein translocase protein TatA
MGISLANIIVILLIVFVLFGAGKLPKVMEDLAHGIKNFKKGLKEEEGEKDKKSDSSDQQK